MKNMAKILLLLSFMAMSCFGQSCNCQIGSDVTPFLFLFPPAGSSSSFEDLTQGLLGATGCTSSDLGTSFTISGNEQFPPAGNPPDVTISAGESITWPEVGLYNLVFGPNINCDVEVIPGGADCTIECIAGQTFTSVLGESIDSASLVAQIATIGSDCPADQDPSFAIVGGNPTEPEVYDVEVSVGDTTETCTGGLTLLAPCDELTKDDLMCPDLSDGDVDDSFLSTCDLPLEIQFPAMAAPSATPRPDCMTPIQVEFKGCSICNHYGNQKLYKDRCIIQENMDGDDSTNDFVIDRIGRDATYLRFVIKAGGDGVKRACRYCVEKFSKCGKRKNHHHLRKLLLPVLGDENEGTAIVDDMGDNQAFDTIEQEEQRELHKRPPPPRDMSCRRNGRCVAPGKW